MSVETLVAPPSELTPVPIDLLELQIRYVRDNSRQELEAYQEAQLADIMADGREAQEKLLLAQEAHLQLHPDIQVALQSKVRQATAAKEVFVAANIGLVKKAALEVFYKSGPKVELEELDAVGMSDLVRCVEEFDSSLGIKFSSFAYRSLVGKMKTWVKDNGRTIRRSRGTADRLTVFDKAIASGSTPEDAAARAGMTLGTVKECREAQKRPDAVSYNTPLSDGEGTELIDIIATRPDSDGADIAEQAVNNATMELLLNGMKKWLAERSRKTINRGDVDPHRDFTILMAAHGFDIPQNEIARRFGISGKRVYQIAKATQRLIDEELPSELRQLAEDLGFLR